MTDDVTATQKAIIEELEYYGNTNGMSFLRVTLVVAILYWLLIVLRVFAIDPYVCTIGYFTAFAIWGTGFIFREALGMRNPALKWILVTLETLGMAAIATAITFHGILLFTFPVVLAAQYANKRLSFYAYALTAVLMGLSGVLGYYWGILDMNVYYFSVLPLEGYRDALTGQLALTPSTLNPVVSVLFYFIFPRFGLLVALYPLILGVAKNAERSITLNILLQRDSERDALTGLYNRDKWKKVQADYRQIDTIAVMFTDINELKYVNDTFGHETGDELIRRVARVLAQVSTERVRTYRIGGDEFVTVIESPVPGEVDDLMAKIRQEIGREALSNGRQCSVAIGASEGSGSSIAKVMGDADEHMFMDKREQKTRLGIKIRE